jgi:hypothetical protein
MHLIDRINNWCGKMTDNELKELVASIAIAQKVTDKQLKETDKQLQDTDLQLKNNNMHLSKQISELGKQNGGLGQKFGSFTEGLALPSMQHILQQQFKMEVISPSVRVHKDGKDIELDVLAYANSSVNEVYVVEVKSHLREEGILQMQSIMNTFRQFFPEHDNKKLFGIIAAVDMSQTLKKRLLSLGFYAAKIKDDIFSLEVPENFRAKSY